MSGNKFEQEIQEGFYLTGRERDQLAMERRKLARQLRYTQHLARLSTLLKQYDAGTVFFAAIGTVILVMFDADGPRGEWWFLAIAFAMIFFSGGIALRRRGIINRKKVFQDRFSGRAI